MSLKRLAIKEYLDEKEEVTSEVLCCAKHAFESKFGPSDLIATARTDKASWETRWTVYIRTIDGLELKSMQYTDPFAPEPPHSNQFRFWQLKGGLFGSRWSKRFDDIRGLGRMLIHFDAEHIGTIWDHGGLGM